MVYKCVIKFIDKNGKQVGRFSSNVLLDQEAPRYARRMEQIYPNHVVQLKWHKVTRAA